MRISLVLLSLFAAASCASAPAPQPLPAGQQPAPRDVVAEHLRAVERGDWEAAEASLHPDFRMQMKGMPAWVVIPRPNALDMHKARKRAFDDFRFNETWEADDGNAVRIAVRLTGTHTGRLDYPIAEVPKLDATGKRIDLPAEYFTYYVRDGRIAFIFGEIPEGHGPPALKRQLGVE